MRDAAEAARSRSRWAAACLTAIVLVALLSLPFAGNQHHVDVTVFGDAFVLAFLGGVGLAVPRRTRRVGVGMLTGVAIALVAALLAGFFWLPGSSTSSVAGECSCNP